MCFRASVPAVLLVVLVLLESSDELQGDAGMGPGGGHGEDRGGSDISLQEEQVIVNEV